MDVDRHTGANTDVDRLYREFRAPLLRLAWMSLGSKEQAEDVVHECFAKYSVLESEHILAPGAYLRTMVLNECRNQIRRRTLSNRFLRQPPPSGEQDADELWDVLMRLTPKRRFVTILRYYEDMSTDSIAAIMNCKRSTVSSLLARSLKQLRKELAE